MFVKNALCSFQNCPNPIFLGSMLPELLFNTFLRVLCITIWLHKKEIVLESDSAPYLAIFLLDIMHVSLNNLTTIIILFYLFFSLLFMDVAVLGFMNLLVFPCISCRIIYIYLYFKKENLCPTLDLKLFSCLHGDVLLTEHKIINPSWSFGQIWIST